MLVTITDTALGESITVPRDEVADSLLSVPWFTDAPPNTFGTIMELQYALNRDRGVSSVAVNLCTALGLTIARAEREVSE